VSADPPLVGLRIADPDGLAACSPLCLYTYCIHAHFQVFDFSDNQSCPPIGLSFSLPSQHLLWPLLCPPNWKQPNPGTVAFILGKSLSLSDEFNYSSKDNEGRSSSHLERVERVQGRAISPKIKSGIMRGLGAVAVGTIILTTAYMVYSGKTSQGENTQPTSATPPTGGGDGYYGALSSDGDSGDSAHGESGGHAGGGGGGGHGSKLRPKSRLDTIADGIVTI
jgi:hypothetical protein